MVDPTFEDGSPDPVTANVHDTDTETSKELQQLKEEFRTRLENAQKVGLDVEGINVDSLNDEQLEEVENLIREIDRVKENYDEWQKTLNIYHSNEKPKVIINVDDLKSNLLHNLFQNRKIYEQLTSNTQETDQLKNELENRLDEIEKIFSSLEVPLEKVKPLLINSKKISEDYRVLQSFLNNLDLGFITIKQSQKSPAEQKILESIEYLKLPTNSPFINRTKDATLFENLNSLKDNATKRRNNPHIPKKELDFYNDLLKNLSKFDIDKLQRTSTSLSSLKEEMRESLKISEGSIINGILEASFGEKFITNLLSESITLSDFLLKIGSIKVFWEDTLSKQVLEYKKHLELIIDEFNKFKKQIDEYESKQKKLTDKIIETYRKFEVSKNSTQSTIDSFREKLKNSSTKPQVTASQDDGNGHGQTTSTTQDLKPSSLFTTIVSPYKQGGVLPSTIEKINVQGLPSSTPDVPLLPSGEVKGSKNPETEVKQNPISLVTSQTIVSNMGILPSSLDAIDLIEYKKRLEDLLTLSNGQVKERKVKDEFTGFEFKQYYADGNDRRFYRLATILNQLEEKEREEYVKNAEMEINKVLNESEIQLPDLSRTFKLPMQREMILGREDLENPVENLIHLSESRNISRQQAKALLTPIGLVLNPISQVIEMKRSGKILERNKSYLIFPGEIIEIDAYESVKSEEGEFPKTVKLNLIYLGDGVLIPQSELNNLKTKLKNPSDQTEGEGVSDFIPLDPNWAPLVAKVILKLKNSRLQSEKKEA